MSDVKAFAGLPIYFEGVDDTTPAGCTIVTTTVVGQVTTYLLRGERIIGRVEHTQDQDGYVGSTLKGGNRIGSGDFTELAKAIAERTA